MGGVGHDALYDGSRPGLGGHRVRSVQRIAWDSRTASLETAEVETAELVHVQIETAFSKVA